MKALLAILLGSLLALPGRAQDAAPPPAAKHKKKPVKKLTLKDLAPRYSFLPPPPEKERAGDIDFPPPPPEKPKFHYPSYYYPQYANPGQPAGYMGAPGQYNLGGTFAFSDKSREDLEQEVQIQNGDLTRAALTKKSWGLTFEGGFLGAGANRNDLTEPSPYLNLRKSVDSSFDSWVDYRLRMSAGMVQMHARYFNDSASDDPQVTALINQLGSAANASGVPAAQTGRYLGYTSYDNGWQTTNIVVTSLLGQVGRAYSLFGPVDFGWAAGALVKTSYIFPNAAVDISAGPRIDLGGSRSLELAGGLTGNASPVGDRLMQDLISDERAFGFNSEKSPHASITYRGTIPGEEGIHLAVTGMRQWNLYTQADTLRGSITTDVGGKPTSLVGTYRHEAGPAIEFDRDQFRVDVNRQFTKAVSGWVGYQKDDIVYGNAQVANSSVLAGLSITLGGSGNEKASAEFVASPKDTVTGPRIEGLTQAVHDLNVAVGDVLSMAEAAQRLAHQPTSSAAGDDTRDPQRMHDLANSIQNITPVQRAALEAAMLAQAQTPEQQQAIRDMFTAQNQQMVVDILNRSGNVLALLGDEQVLENVAVRLARHEMVHFFQTADFPIAALGLDMRLTPGVLLAGMQTLMSRGSPLSPITAADQQSVLEPFIWGKLGASLGLPPGATPAQVTAALIAKAPPSIQAQLAQGGPQFLASSIDALAEMIRREANMMVIQYILAAEQLDRLTVDGGRKLGDLDGDMLDYSFKRLDERRMHRVLSGAAKSLQTTDD